MSEEPIPEIGPEQIDTVLRFLPILGKPGYTFGESQWITGASDG